MDKYLSNYAERGTAAVADIPAGEPWRQVVVIPVCNEPAGILRPLPAGPGRSLMVLVVNETETASQGIAGANRDPAVVPHPDRYDLDETTEPGYIVRTEANVRDSDATLVLTFGTPLGGSAATIGLADTTIKFFIYFIHERAWNRIDFGREQKQPEYFI